ncbi:hypothetical protein [Streptomyces sp. NPDC048111]|uniref:hypothetical protein n=1 Tax=Streptomyces sp. NPDC048111 TaxID=3365500 RepID=UPI0037235B3C
MTYVVSVETHIPEGAPEMDPLQRAGAVAILESGLDSVEGIEGPDGMEADLHETIVAVYPGGALLRIFVDAPALEFAEEAVRSVVGELLERSELLAEWTVDRCEVQLHPDLAQESLAAADGPDAPPDDPASRKARHAAQAAAGTGGYDQRSPRYLAALGLLLLRGVTAASSGGDRSAAKDFLTEATDVARYVALDRPDAWANFSPTNVALHAVSAANAFGDAGVALETAGPLMRRHIPAPERRAALWVEAARAYSQRGRLADGYQALRIAENCAAQDVRRPAVRELVADMAARDRRRTLPELHHFSRQLGAPA